MKGYVIVDTKICVDYWDDSEEEYFRFLTHAHPNRLDGIDKISGNVYTSDFTGWYVENIIKITSCSFVHLQIGITYTLTSGKDKNEFSFDVTLINANHCPGSVMFLFQGNFGNVLCTGDFRFITDMLEHPLLKEISGEKSLDILNVDNQFFGERCNFPSQEKCIEEILEVIRSYPDHRIEICIGVLGKICLLKCIADCIKYRICVSSTCMAVVEKLGCDSCFTTNENITNIFALEVDVIDKKYAYSKRKELGPVKFIVLTPIYSFLPNFKTKLEKLKKKYGIHIIPYSDHSSRQELVQFFSFLQPSTIVPIFESNINEVNKIISAPKNIYEVIDENGSQLATDRNLKSESNSFLSCQEGVNKFHSGSTSSTDIQKQYLCPESIKQKSKEALVSTLDESILPSSDNDESSKSESSVVGKSEFPSGQSNLIKNELKKSSPEILQRKLDYHSMDSENSLSSDENEHCKEPIIKRRKSKRMKISGRCVSEGESLHCKPLQQTISPNSSLSDEKQCGNQNNDEPLALSRSDTDFIKNVDDIKNDKDDFIRVSTSNIKRHSSVVKRKTSLKRVKEKVDNNISLHNDTNVGVSADELKNSSCSFETTESPSILEHITSQDVSHIEFGLDEAILGNISYTTSLCPWKQEVSEDELNFWISRGVKADIFKDCF